MGRFSWVALDYGRAGRSAMSQLIGSICRFGQSPANDEADPPGEGGPGVCCSLWIGGPIASRVHITMGRLGECQVAPSFV